MKELAIELIRKLPDDVDITDIIDALYVKVNVMQGINDAQNGKEDDAENFLNELQLAGKVD